MNFHIDTDHENSDEDNDLGIDKTVDAALLLHRQKQDDTYKWDRLHVAAHNINGLKGDPTKLHKLIEWALDENFHIIGLSETNIDPKEGKWLNRDLHSLDYTGYWSTKDNKIKGSGVALIITTNGRNTLEKLDLLDLIS